MTDFHQGRSSFDNLYNLITKHRIRFSTKLTSDCCPVDNNNAYNNTNNTSVLNILNKLRNDCFFL